MGSLLLLTSALAAWGQNDVNRTGAMLLREKSVVGQQIHAKVHLIIQGKMKISNKDESLAGQALLEFDERVLAVGADGFITKSVRDYSDGRARFVVGGGEDARVLRDTARVVLADWPSTGIRLASFSGPLTGDERELMQDVLDASRLPGLLPTEAVKVGDTWEPIATALLGIVDLDHFTKTEVKCTLTKIEGGKAVIHVFGQARGVSLGADVATKVDGELKFNTEKNIIESLVWRQQDQRSDCPVSPSGEYDVRVTVERSLVGKTRLTDEFAASVEKAAPPTLLVSYESPNGFLSFQHDRSWHVTTSRRDSAVLRSMDKGEFVAQLNVTALGQRAAGSTLPPQEFQDLILKNSGVQVEEIVRADAVNLLDEKGNPSTLKIQFLAATGSNGKVRLAQRHYLATTPTGQQVLFSFLLEPKNEDRLGGSDLQIVRSLQLNETTASK